MSDQKNFYIGIMGTKIRKNDSGSKEAIMDSSNVLKDFKANNWNEAKTFADQKAKLLKDTNGWHDFHVVVVESVPHITAVYSMHLEEIKKIVGPYFGKYWSRLMGNQLIIRNKSRLTDNNHKLLVGIVASFLYDHCNEFKEYKQSVRKDEMEDFEKAVSGYIIGYYLHFESDTEASEQKA